MFLMSSGTSSQRALCAGGRLEVVEDRVEVDLLEVAAPRRARLAEEGLERLQAEVEHPLGLALVGRDLADDVLVEADARLEDGELRVVEAVLVLADVERELGGSHTCSFGVTAA